MYDSRIALTDAEPMVTSRLLKSGKRSFEKSSSC
jgi:hypothetical protein